MYQTQRLPHPSCRYWIVSLCKQQRIWILKILEYQLYHVPKWYNRYSPWASPPPHLSLANDIPLIIVIECPFVWSSVSNPQANLAVYKMSLGTSEILSKSKSSYASSMRPRSKLSGDHNARVLKRGMCKAALANPVRKEINAALFGDNAILQGVVLSFV